MDWIADPSIWAGLLTLILLEIVLGIDNLIFIAILSEKAPPHLRDRARQIGLALAMLMRLGLLAGMSWLMSLTSPLFEIMGNEFSGRDLILIVGGLFLLLKATTEIHDRMEPDHGHTGPVAVYAGFGTVVAQIVVLDAVFSLDAVITAIGMVDELYLMMAAVIIAMGVMIVASKPLTAFINARPSLVILCLGFLLMVGFALIADGFDFHIPKGYLYAAIGFSVLIETFNQVALGKRRRWIASLPPRQRVASAVLRLLAGVPVPAHIGNADLGSLVTEDEKRRAFATTEQEIVRRVLTLAERPVSAIMTPRMDMEWIDADRSTDHTVEMIGASIHRQFVVSRGAIENVIGIVRREDVLRQSVDGEAFNWEALVHKPIAAHEDFSILRTLELFKKSPVEMAIVVDEYGALQGMVTQTDLLQAIAGHLPQTDNEQPEIEECADGSLVVSGTASIFDVQLRLGLGSLPEGDFDTVAGLVLHLSGRIPEIGDTLQWEGWQFRVLEMDVHRIEKVLMQRVATAEGKGERRQG